jgi:3-dehydroquinate synthetase
MSVELKAKIVSEDEHESGARALLNLGHTVGHAIELASNFHLRHGEAVAIGMVAEARLAERLRVASAGLSDAIAGALAALGLPVRIPDELPNEEIIRAMKVDKKKSTSGVRFALPAAIGQVELVDVPDVRLALE